MRKEIYKTLLSLEGINPELIEWKKLVKYAPKELFTEEFVNEHKEELYKNGFIIKRPKLSIKLGLMEDFINTLDADDIRRKDEKCLDGIVERIDNALLNSSTDGNENFIRLIELIIKKFPEKESFTMKFFKVEDEMSLIQTDNDVIAFHLMMGSSIYFNYIIGGMNKLQNIFMNKYSNKDEAMQKLANFTMSMYQRKIVDGEFVLKLDNTIDEQVFSDDEIKKVIDETPLTLLTRSLPSMIPDNLPIGNIDIRKHAFNNYRVSFISKDRISQILETNYSVDND